MAIATTGIQPADPIQATEKQLNETIGAAFPSVVYLQTYVEAVRAELDAVGIAVPYAPATAQAIESWQIDAMALLIAFKVVAEKQAVIAPYRINGDPALYCGIVPRSAVPAGQLGFAWLAFGTAVLKFATSAAVAAAGFYVVNLIAKVAQTWADAEKLKAQAAADLAAAVKANPAQAQAIGNAAVAAGLKAQGAAADAPGLLDRLFGGAAQGIGSAVPILILLWFMLRKK